MVEILFQRDVSLLMDKTKNCEKTAELKIEWSKIVFDWLI